MPDPATFRSSAEARTFLEDYLEDVNGLASPLHLDDSSPMEDAARARGRAHRAEVVTFVAEAAVGAGEAAHVLAPAAAAVAAPAAALVGCGAGLVAAWTEGDVLARQYEYERALGSLAMLEGRPNTRRDPSVASRNFGDGYAAMAAELRTPSERGERARAALGLLRDEGYAAVVEGRDRGAAFQRRYHDDLVFRHAVDHARRARASDPARYAAIQAGLAERSVLSPRSSRG